MYRSYNFINKLLWHHLNRSCFICTRIPPVSPNHQPIAEHKMVQRLFWRVSLSNKSDNERLLQGSWPTPQQSSSCSTKFKSWIISPLPNNSTLGVGATVPGSRAKYSAQDKSFITSYQAIAYNPTDQRQSKPSQWTNPLVSEYLWPMQVFIEVFSEDFLSFHHRNISQCWSLQLTESLDWEMGFTTSRKAWS